MEPSSDSKTVLKCDYCGDEFEKYTYRITDGNNFCTKTCRVNHQQADNHYEPCSNCGSDVKIPPSRMKGEYGDYHLENHFCDKECESEWKQENWVGEDHPSWSGGPETVSCVICDADIEVVQSVAEERDNFTCSVDCQAEWQTRHRGDLSTPRFVDVECAWCGKEYQRKPQAVKKTENSLCSDECFSAWMSEQRRGSGNPAFKGGKSGITAVRRMIGEQSWDKTAREVRAGAGHVCQQCGKFQPHRKLSAHHIIPVASGGTNGHWNLVALCGSCHQEVEAYTKQFTEPHLLKYANKKDGAL